MDDTTIDHASEEPNSDPRRGLTRRQVGIAAAWVAPVVVMATHAPLASASIQDVGTTVKVQTETSLSGNTTPGTQIEGSAGGQVIITNVGNSWQAAPITARFTLTGPVNTDIHTLKYGGVDIPPSGSITIGSNIWTINYSNTITGGVLVYLQLQGVLTVPANGSVSVTLPVITFSTTSNGTPTAYNPIRWQLEVGALENGGNPTVSISDLTGKSIPAV